MVIWESVMKGVCLLLEGKQNGAYELKIHMLKKSKCIVASVFKCMFCI